MGKRPTAMIMRDEWFGHRDPFFPDIKRGDRDEYIDWDFALLEAVTTIEVFTDEFGLLKWDVEDDNVVVEAHKRIHKFASAKDRATSKKNYKADPGEYFVPYLKLRADAEVDMSQTFSEWIQKERAKEE